MDHTQAGLRWSGCDRSPGLARHPSAMDPHAPRERRVAHSGALSCTVNSRKIPAAALSSPDADVRERMLEGSRAARLYLETTCPDLPYETSAGVIAEVPGGS